MKCKGIRSLMHIIVIFSLHAASLHMCLMYNMNPLWDSSQCLGCGAVTAEMMDHVIRLEKNKDSLQLDLQFTVSFVHGPFLHEKDNWATVSESEIVFFNNTGSLVINQVSCRSHVTRQGISQICRVILLHTM